MIKSSKPSRGSNVKMAFLAEGTQARPDLTASRPPITLWKYSGSESTVPNWVHGANFVSVLKSQKPKIRLEASVCLSFKTPGT